MNRKKLLAEETALEGSRRCVAKGIDKRLIESIAGRSLKIAVIGCGYVGLPTAALFADVGFQVTAFDKRIEVAMAVNNGLSPIHEAGLEEIIHRNNRASRLVGSSDTKWASGRFDAVLVAVQTPVDSSGKSDLSAFSAAIDQIGDNLSAGMLVMVISTVPIGTMNRTAKERLETISHLKAESDFLLAYSPERMSPGRAVEEFRNNKRIVGGIGPRSTRVASHLFKTVCETITETDAQTAEVTKLAENAFRNANIAFANQLALICESAEVDASEVIRLANTHPRVDILSPGPGAGGPCLRKDSLALIQDYLPIETNLLRTANSVNSHMATHVVHLVQQGLTRAGKTPCKSRIAVLGTTYKRDVDDVRDSPAEPVINGMMSQGMRVMTFDPYSSESFGGVKTRSVEECVQKCDAIVLMTDHSDFSNISLEKIRRRMNAGPFVVDARRAFNPILVSKSGFDYLGIGWGVRLTESH